MAGAGGVALTGPTGAAPFGCQALGAPAAITVTASPFTYTNNTPNIQFVSVQAPASATITITKRGVQISNQVTAAATATTLVIPVGPGESLIVTYTVAPTMQADTP
jgi:hypothetical protein